MSKGLGRGLDAFFGEGKEDLQNVTTATKENRIIDKVVELNINKVEPMLNQPRKLFDKDKLQELSDSIKEHGVLQPILVVKDENGYTIVAGERRWRAAKLAGIKDIPAIIKDYTDTKKKQVALIENIQREDLNIVEVAKAIKELMDIDGFSQSEVAKITGKNVSTISNIMRLLNLQDIILESLMDGKIVEGHARALLAIKDEKIQIEILNKIIEKKLTVRDVEKLVYGADDYKRKKDKKKPKNIHYEKIENKLQDYFGHKVKLITSKTHQQIVIEYNDDEGLESVLSKLKIRL